MSDELFVQPGETIVSRHFTRRRARAERDRRNRRATIDKRPANYEVRKAKRRFRYYVAH